MAMLYVFLQFIYSVVLFIALTVLLLLYFTSTNIFSAQKPGKEPPGPSPLPVIGNLLQLDLGRLHGKLLKLSKKYGSVFTIYLGPKKVVVLVGYKTVKEALVNHAEVFGQRDLVRIMDEAIQGHGEAFDVNQSISNATANVICSMIYGSRFDYNDPEFTSLVFRVCRNNKLLNAPSIQLYNLFPWIGKWLFYPKLFKKSFAASREHHLKLLSHWKETLDPKKCRGFVDAFLVRQENLEKSGITTSHFHKENLLMTVMNLFVGGTETSSRTVKWGLFLMAKYPKIQDKVQEELRNVIGDRQVQSKDRIDLPFINAVIHETQRLTAIASLGLPHKTARDITFRGHFIKKGTTVFPFLMSVLSDESEWEKPNTFYPEHFLDKDGKFLKRDAFMAFSAGSRICPGESLARMELFIFFTTLLQHFRFTLPPGVSQDDLSPCDSLILNPSDVKLCAVPIM